MVEAVARRVAPVSGSSFLPTEGGFLTVHLPGEVMRCRVDRVVNVDAVIVEITDTPTSRTHLYRKGDMTGARRRTEYGRDIWEALSDRDFMAGRSPNVPVVPEPPAAEPEKPRAKATKTKRVGKGKKARAA